MELLLWRIFNIPRSRASWDCCCGEYLSLVVGCLRVCVCSTVWNAPNASVVPDSAKPGSQTQDQEVVSITYLLTYLHLLILASLCLLFIPLSLPVCRMSFLTVQGSYRPWKVLESPGIKMLRFPGLESPGKGHRSWKTLEKSWNSNVVVLEILISGTSITN